MQYKILNKRIVLLVRTDNYRKLAYMSVAWCHAVRRNRDVKNKSILTYKNKTASQLQTVM